MTNNLPRLTYGESQTLIVKAFLVSVGAKPVKLSSIDEFNRDIDLSVVNQDIVRCQGCCDKKHHFISWEDWH